MIVNWLDIVLGVLVLSAAALPFFQIEHGRHAQAITYALIPLSAFWIVVYEMLRVHFLGVHAQDHFEPVLLRGYAFSSALCSLFEEIFSMRDESKEVRPIRLAVFGALCVGTLVFLALSMFS